MTEITDLSPTDASNTSVTGESLDGAVANMGRMDNTLQAILGMLARSIRTNVFRLIDPSDDTKRVAFDVSGVTAGATRTVTVPDRNGTLAFSNNVDTRRNRIVNGDKLVSQENGQTGGTTNGRYISDQNAMFFVSSNGVFTGVNVAGRTSPAGGNRDRITVTTADSALAAGEYLTYTQNIEGSNVGDLKWGTANAVPLIVRRGIRAPQGTWPVAFHNSAANRSYVTTFTVSAGQANADLVHEFAIPGDTTGTWLTADGVIGLTMDFVIGAGSTFQGVAGWQAGNILTVSGATNGMGMAGAVFEFFDEGMKADPASTGIYGQHEVGEVDAVYRSERYFERALFPTGNLILSPVVTGTTLSMTVGYASYGWKERKCKVPTMGDLAFSNSTGTSIPDVDSVRFMCSGATSSAAVQSGFYGNARLS